LCADEVRYFSSCDTIFGTDESYKYYQAHTVKCFGNGKLEDKPIGDENSSVLIGVPYKVTYQNKKIKRVEVRDIYNKSSYVISFDANETITDERLVNADFILHHYLDKGYSLAHYKIENVIFNEKILYRDNIITASIITDENSHLIKVIYYDLKENKKYIHESKKFTVEGIDNSSNKKYKFFGLPYNAPEKHNSYWCPAQP